MYILGELPALLPAAIRVVENEPPSIPLIFLIIWLALIPVFLAMVWEALSWLIKGKKGLRKGLIWSAAALAVAAAWILPQYIDYVSQQITCEVGMTRAELRNLNREPDIVVARESGDEPFMEAEDIEDDEVKEAWIYMHSSLWSLRAPISVFLHDNGRVVAITEGTVCGQKARLDALCLDAESTEPPIPGRGKGDAAPLHRRENRGDAIQSACLWEIGA